MAAGLGVDIRQGERAVQRSPHDEARSVATIHAALDAGVTLIDTADAYHLHADEVGHNEELIARALRTYGGDTSGVLVATNINDLAECAVTARMMASRQLEPARIPENPLDVLAQHLVSL